METTAAIVPAFSNPDISIADDTIRLLLTDTRSSDTKRAYTSDLKDFFHYRSQIITPAAVAELCSLQAGPLAITLNGYKANLLSRGLSEATVNRRLAAVRSLLRTARQLGAGCPDPAGLVSSEKVFSYRDTRGPSLAEARKLITAPDITTVRGLRDRAILLLLCENALRRGEVVKCNVGDFDGSEKRLWILGKGKGTQKQAVTLSNASCDAIMAYLIERLSPNVDAPLFCTAARFVLEEQRLTGRGLLYMINEYGMQVLKKPMHPHALRHMAITVFLDANGGDVRTAQRLSRHADIRTLQRYDDNREDLQGKATNILSDLIHSRP